MYGVIEGASPLWGEERITNELPLKLAIRLSPRKSGTTCRAAFWAPRGDQRRSTFLKEPREGIIACDLFDGGHYDVPDALCFCAHPTAEWTLQQLREVIGSDDTYQYLIHDRDAIFARHLDDSIKALGLNILKSPLAIA